MSNISLSANINYQKKQSLLFVYCYNWYALIYLKLPLNLFYLVHTQVYLVQKVNHYISVIFLTSSSKDIVRASDFPQYNRSACAHIYNKNIETGFHGGHVGIENFIIILPEDMPSASLILNGTLILGQEQDSPSGGFDFTAMFFGYVAQLNIWSRTLEVTEIKNMAACKINHQGDVLSLESYSMSQKQQEIELFGGAKIEDQELESLCLQEDPFVVFPEEKPLQEIPDFCKRIGGYVYVPQTTEMNEELYKLGLKFSSKFSSKYLFW
ncbi:unnamed protein product, partial [Meganyctiphanes norvegica]